MKEYQNDDHRLICALSPDLTLTQIGKKFGITSADVRSVCEKYGVEYRCKGERVGSMAHKIKKLLECGLSTGAICDELDCLPEHVRKVRYDLKMPSGGKKMIITDRERKIVARINMLRKDGMTAKDACAATSISHATYQRYKKALE